MAHNQLGPGETVILDFVPCLQHFVVPNKYFIIMAACQNVSEITFIFRQMVDIYLGFLTPVACVFFVSIKMVTPGSLQPFFEPNNVL